MSSLWQGGNNYGLDSNGKRVVTSTINGIGGANAGTVGTMFFGTISGGAGAAISGGNFWQGAVTGLVVSGLNHTLHDGDNGYDTEGNKISNKGGNKTDYLYNKEGHLLGSKSVICIGTDWCGMTSLDGSIPKLTMRGFGVKSYLATGAITVDNTIFEFYAGGKLLSLAGKGFNSFTGGVKQWFRVGSSYSIEVGFNTVSIRWGAGGNHWKNIGSEYLQSLNKSFRQMKISFDNWRTADPGHFHLWKK
jgi:hypothetical protein